MDVTPRPKLPKTPSIPEPEPTMTLEEMRAIREKNLAAMPGRPPEEKEPETIPVSDVNDLVVKLAGGARRMP
jgi:hypothetical protein